MKKTLVLLLILLTLFPLQAIATSPNNVTLYATYQSPAPGNIQFVSYSENWNTGKLQQLYQELLQNHYGNEIDYLAKIIIYPDSNYGVAGYYVEDLRSDGKGGFKYGDNSYIELFNGDKHTTIESLAGVLSHEYGHHYTLYNILRKEGLQIKDWQKSEYYKIRNLGQYTNVIIGKTNLNRYTHIWDIAEIAAEDYVQLLGSANAKNVVDFMDVDGILEAGQTVEYYSDSMFNILPQENLQLPLAADVSGLYEYMVGLSDKSRAAKPVVLGKPAMELSVAAVYFDQYTKYTVGWNEIFSETPLHYTLVMYPENDSSFPIPLGTVKSGEKMEVAFGSSIKNQGDGTWQVVYNPYKGAYLFRLFIFDANGFMYSSELYRFNFDQGGAFSKFPQSITVSALDSVYSFIQPAGMENDRISWQEVFQSGAVNLKYKTKGFSGYII